MLVTLRCVTGLKGKFGIRFLLPAGSSQGQGSALWTLQHGLRVELFSETVWIAPD